MFCFVRTALWPLGWREEDAGSTDFWAVATVEGPSRANVQHPFVQGLTLRRSTVPSLRFTLIPKARDRFATGPSTCSLIPQKSYRSRHPPPAIPIPMAVDVTG